MFERGHEHGRGWPRTCPERGHERGRENDLIGHVVTWPECSAMLWAMFRPRWTWPKRGQKVTALRRTWPETWPATWPRGRQRTWPFDDEPDPNMADVVATLLAMLPNVATFTVLFSHFSDFLAVQCVLQSQTLFAQVRTLEIKILFANTIFSPNFSKCKSSKSDLENHLKVPNWLSAPWQERAATRVSW